LTDISASY